LSKLGKTTFDDNQTSTSWYQFDLVIMFGFSIIKLILSSTILTPKKFYIVFSIYLKNFSCPNRGLFLQFFHVWGSLIYLYSSLTPSRPLCFSYSSPFQSYVKNFYRYDWSNKEIKLSLPTRFVFPKGVTPFESSFINILIQLKNQFRAQNKFKRHCKLHF